jgi:ADP-dependent phosphofructokinase/glucokinase
MKKKEKLFNENGKDIFEFNFGFNFPQATWKMLGRTDNRYIKKTDDKNKRLLNKKNK